MRFLRPVAVAGLVCTVVTVLAGCGGSTGGHGNVTRPGSAGGTAAAPGSDSGAPSGPTSGAPATGARFDDPTRAAALLAAAKHDVTVANSYDYRHLPEALAAGLAVSTGSFRDQYRHAFVDVIEKQAPVQHFVQKATINAAGLGPITGGEATVLVFGQLAITGSKIPHGRTDPFVATVGLRQVGAGWLIDRVETNGSISAPPAGNAPLAAAAVAARTGVADVLSFRRATFDADFARALAATTGTLRTDLAAKKAATLKTMTSGNFDLDATVTAVAAMTVSASTVVFLVGVDGYQVKSGTRGQKKPESLEATVTEAGGRWLLSNVTSVGVS